MRRSSGRPSCETTALGAAWLAGHKAGVWPDAEGFGKLWKLDRAFKPALAAAERERKYAGWKRAVAPCWATRAAGEAASTYNHQPVPKGTTTHIKQDLSTTEVTGKPSRRYVGAGHEAEQRAETHER